MTRNEIECECCGGVAYGNAKDGYRCSDRDCAARREFDATRAPYTCERCGATNSHPTDEIRCYRVEGEVLCADCLADTYSHGDCDVSWYADIAVVTPNDGSEAFAFLPTDAAASDMDDLLLTGVPAAN